MKSTNSTALGGHQTTERVKAAPAIATIPRDPEFIRLPKAGTLCPHTGLTRSKLNELILPCAVNDFRAPVASVVLRQRGKLKGVRLIDYASLISFIRSQMDDATMEIERAHSMNPPAD